MTDLLQQSDIREAQERAARIRLGMVSYLATLADIRSAWDRRDWLTLGYDDWDSYLDGEFSETRLRIPAEHRAKAITELRMAGMSTRAIAATVNLSQSTVSREVNELSQMTQLDQPEKVKGLDGKERPAVQPKPAARQPEPQVEPKLAYAAKPAALSPASEESLTDTDFEPWDIEPAPSASTFPQSVPRPEPSPIDEDAAVRSSAKVGESLAALFLALDPDPLLWAEYRWRPAAFGNRNLPRVRDAFTSEGLRKLGDHLYTLADHLDENGASL